MTSRNGFTLVELMVVVAIIAFLATIALPRYTSYFDKARQAEVAINLASLHTAQKAYYAQHGTYSKILWGKDGIGWKPDGYKGGGKNENFYFTYGFNFPGAQEGVHYFTGKSGAPAQALGSTHANTQSFLAAAACITRSQAHDVWHINESRTITHVSDPTN